MSNFIIDEKIVKAIRETLDSYIKHIDEDCGRSGCMCDLRGDECSQWIQNVLHDFDTSLHLLEEDKGDVPIYNEEGFSNEEKEKP